ncbi:MAG: tetratricopeptide repeat protein [Candidatus Melainabacteria bacterium]|nr:tetratricopeptide repeat protein [Candidatus Melainabacteria bacterium]
MIRPLKIHRRRAIAAASLLLFPLAFPLPSSAQAPPGLRNIPEDVERLQGKSLDHPPDLVHPSVDPAAAPDLSPPGLLKSVDLAIPSPTATPVTGESLPELAEKDIIADPDLPSRLKKYLDQAESQLQDGKFSQATSTLKRALTDAEKLDKNKDQITAIISRRLGESYTGRQMYPEAAESFEQEAEILKKLGLTDPALARARTALAEHYSELDMSGFGQGVLERLKEAGVNRITVLKNIQAPRIQIEFAQKLIRDIKSKAVNKVGFDKIVAFDFKSLGDNRFALANIQGLQVKAKFWVNLIDSLMELDQNQSPTAHVTGEKMGKQKTVDVKVPQDIYDRSLEILTQLKTSIDSLMHPAPGSPSESAPEEETRTSSESGPQESDSGFPRGKRGSDELDRLKGKGLVHPPDVVDSSLNSSSSPAADPDVAPSFLTPAAEPPMAPPIQPERPALINP